MVKDKDLPTEYRLVIMRNTIQSSEIGCCAIVSWMKLSTGLIGFPRWRARTTRRLLINFVPIEPSAATSSKRKAARSSSARAKISFEEMLDMKFPISTPNMDPDAVDVVTGYKYLFVVELVCRDLKNVLEICPVLNWLKYRFYSYFLICWMAMLLIGYTERKSSASWFSILPKLDDIAAGLIEIKT